MKEKNRKLRIKLSNAIRSSLFAQSGRILAVLIFLLIVLFYFIPREAYVIVEIESDRFVLDELEKTNSDCLIEDLEFCAESCTSYLNSWDDNRSEMYIELWHHLPIVNDKVIGDGWPLSIRITPINDRLYSLNSTVRIQREQKNSFFHCKVDKYSSLSTFGSFHPNSFNRGIEAYFSYSTKFEVEENGNMVILISGCSVDFSVDSGFFEQFNENELKIIIPANTTIQFRNHIYGSSFHNITQIQSKIRCLKDLSLFGDGSISVKYTADSKEYKVNKQPLILKSKSNNLSLSLSQITDDPQPLYSISAYGFADQVKTANISLIPSFFSWFKENVYLLPTILVTVITGSIQLIKNNKKNE